MLVAPDYALSVGLALGVELSLGLALGLAESVGTGGGIGSGMLLIGGRSTRALEDVPLLPLGSVTVT